MNAGEGFGGGVDGAGRGDGIAVDVSETQAGGDQAQALCFGIVLPDEDGDVGDFIDDASAGAEDGFAIAKKIVVEADAGREVLVIGVVGLTDLLADLHHALGRIEVGEEIVAFFDGEGDVIPEAGVDHEARRGAPGVLNECAE